MTGLSDSAARKSGLDPRPWEIWLAYVRFADHPDVGKVRPIVIIDERVSAIVAAKVTTAAPQKRFLYCELTDWQAEGLLRPSRAQVVPRCKQRLTPQVSIDSRYFSAAPPRERT